MGKKDRLRFRERLSQTSISDIDGTEWKSAQEMWDYFMNDITDEQHKKWNEIVLYANWDYDYDGDSRGYIEVIGYHDETDAEFAKRQAREAEQRSKERAMAAQRKKLQEEEERAEYERLKKKFG